MNDYRKQYDELIQTARIESVKYDRGYEIHHIVPKCLGGSDEPRNLVKLWPIEHLKAHWLLSKFSIGNERQKMERVFEKMLMSASATRGQINKDTFRNDALKDVEFYSALPVGLLSRREGLSKAATKFLASEKGRKGSRPLAKH
jgi:hypothetical protein